MKIVVKGLLVGFISKYMNEIFIKSKLNNTDKNNNLEVKEKDMLSINSNYVSYLKIFDIEDISACGIEEINSILFFLNHNKTSSNVCNVSTGCSY